uniref:Uncharacterized protein n=1 Tax=Anguilla anguilla TaxID=7936 RepID=A0A0E9XHM0_ANGAN
MATGRGLYQLNIVFMKHLTPWIGSGGHIYRMLNEVFSVAQEDFIQWENRLLLLQDDFLLSWYCK